MASGKELVRTVTCGYWKKIKEMKEYCSYQIYDCNGKKLDLNSADKSKFCNMIIIFKDLSVNMKNLLSMMIQMLSSTQCEHMNVQSFDYYGFTQIIIS